MQWEERAAEQDGLISRRQLLDSGLSSAQAWQQLRTRRWQVVGRGVYATFTGRLDEYARVRAALLATGPESAASHGTALWLLGLRAEPPARIQVSVPASRRVIAPPGVRLHRRRDFANLVHAASDLRRTRLEATVLDVAETMSDLDPVLSLVFTATQRRLTTAARLRAELTRRPRHRWRRLLVDVLADVDDGVQSPLERLYKRDVERPHGLPRGTRNRPETTRAGRNRFHDVRYRRWRVLVELDGRAAHPDSERFRDFRRDNGATVDDGDAVLRYGWHDVLNDPCGAAGQVARMLTHRGWPNTPTRCPRCPESP